MTAFITEIKSLLIYSEVIVELATLHVNTSLQQQFERDFKIAGQYISSINGYLGHSLHKCIEQDNKYILLVSWRNIEDHTIGFRQSEAYISWKNLLHHYYVPFPVVEHFETIIENKN